MFYFLFQMGLTHWAISLLAISIVAFVYGVPDYSDLPRGPYCERRGCCSGRVDQCAQPIVGKQKKKKKRFWKSLTFWIWSICLYEKEALNIFTASDRSNKKLYYFSCKRDN